MGPAGWVSGFQAARACRVQALAAPGWAILMQFHLQNIILPTSPPEQRNLPSASPAGWTLGWLLGCGRGFRAQSWDVLQPSMRGHGQLVPDLAVLWVFRRRGAPESPWAAQSRQQCSQVLSWAGVDSHSTVSLLLAGGHHARALWLHPAHTSVGVLKIPQITWSGTKELLQGSTDSGSTKPLHVKAALERVGSPNFLPPKKIRKGLPPGFFFVLSTICSPRGETGGAEMLPGVKRPRVCCFTGAGAADPPSEMRLSPEPEVNAPKMP